MKSAQRSLMHSQLLQPSQFVLGLRRIWRVGRELYRPPAPPPHRIIFALGQGRAEQYVERGSIRCQLTAARAAPAASYLARLKLATSAYQACGK